LTVFIVPCAYYLIYRNREESQPPDGPSAGLAPAV